MMDNIDEVIELKPLKKTDKKVYKCAICGFQTLFKTLKSLHNHKKTNLAPEELKLFACIHCDKKYTSRQDLRRHIEDNHIDSRSKNPQENIHKCSICGYQTRRAAYFRKHQNIHLTLEERQLFACTHCDKKYTTKYFLRRHLEDNHIDSRSKNLQENIHKCSICGYQTRRAAYFRKHQNVHLALEERQMFACTHCDKKYTTKYFLQRHLEDNHIDSRSKAARKNNHKCSTCGYQTPYISCLQRHQEIHLTLDERQLFACAHCDKKYTSKQRLKFHLDVNHIDSRSKAAEIKVLLCAICGYQTLDKPNFYRHEKIHMAPEDRQLFACEHCDKKYRKKQALQDHLEKKHIDARNADCTSSTDEVILDALKIEIDDLASPLDDSKNSECLSVINEIKSEDFIKTEPEDVAPIMKTEVHDDFKSSENESATRNVKLEDFIKMEPDDDV